ncbi:exostosin domain-containing protein [Hymenobacter bucti]|uniref:Exostosin family protein n=1 Tax=Hymenobacter bucti TaxID=1844114 RepID=A0ABW4QT80_9BACT
MINVFCRELNDDRMQFVDLSVICQKTAIENALFIIHHELLWSLPNTNSVLKEISDNYKFCKKFIIVFIVDDFEGQYNLYKNLLLIRTSITASKKRKNEIVLPYVWEGMDVPFGPVRNIKPSVGFCGQNGIHRKKLIHTFQQSDVVVTNFVIREHFWGGAPHNPDIIKDFRKNMEENAFILSQRGNGNFSIRFYQTLSAGRIPVLVNTDMELPFKDIINWSEYIVFEKNEEDCLNKIKQLHHSGDYLLMQEKCSELYNNYFAPKVFFDQLMMQIVRKYCVPNILFPSIFNL